MPQLLGDNVLPSSVERRRRQVRERINDLRRPVRRRRAELVPGPNLIGRIENELVDARDRFVRREGMVERIRDMRGENSDEEEEEEQENNQSRGSNAERQVRT